MKKETIKLTTEILKELYSGEENVEGWEGWTIECVTNEGDFDAEKGAMTDFPIYLYNPEGNLVAESQGGYYNAGAGMCFDDDLKFKYVNTSKKNQYVPFVSEVEEFNQVMGKPNNYEPTIPPENEWMFVYNFILEELEEYKEACQKGDIVGVLDALCDITYVSLGNGTLLHGLKDKIQAAYQEVQASNMSKSCKTEEEALETIKIRSAQHGPCHFEKQGEYWIVYRTSDRKVMKSCLYNSPDLFKFFTKDEIKLCQK